MKVYKALFIDDREVDNFLNRLMVKEEALPIEPVFVYSADEALAYLSDASDEEFPDLIFIDIDMPEKTGFDFVEQYSSEYPDKANTHLFFLTGVSDPEIKNKALAYDLIKGFYPKPIRKNIFKQVLEVLSQ